MEKKESFISSSGTIVYGDIISSDDYLSGEEKQKRENLKRLGELVRMAIPKEETLDSFSRKTGTSKSYLSRLLNGKLKSYPKAQTLEKIVRAGGGLVNLDDILHYIGITSTSSVNSEVPYVPRDATEPLIEEMRLPIDSAWTAGTFVLNFLHDNGIFSNIEYGEKDSSIFKLRIQKVTLESSLKIPDSKVIIPIPCFYSQITPTAALNQILITLLNLLDAGIEGENQILRDYSNLYFVTNSKILFDKMEQFFHTNGKNPCLILTSDYQNVVAISADMKEVAFSK